MIHLLRSNSKAKVGNPRGSTRPSPLRKELSYPKLVPEVDTVVEPTSPPGFGLIVDDNGRADIQPPPRLLQEPLDFYNDDNNENARGNLERSWRVINELTIDANAAPEPKSTWDEMLDRMEQETYAEDQQPQINQEPLTVPRSFGFDAGIPLPKTFETQAHPALTNSYPPTTQFFILDAAGNDPSGLAVYTPLPPHPDSMDVNPSTGERLYHLTPCATVFRACESRLVPVRWRFGDRVMLRDNETLRFRGGQMITAMVLRRTVVRWERRYDVKDERGVVWRDMGEDMLSDVTHDGLS